MNMLLGILMMACSSIPVREAQSVVTQADSLWQAGQMYGIDAGDSITLAQAYEILKKHSAPSLAGKAGGEVFSHACYHYGRLLRTKDNPVEAMQAFIAATHSRTRDYHILGRVYSNMGSICHLAGEFPLSYDMYERSANSFLLGGDTTAYYYALNDMAFELAEQGKKEETLALNTAQYDSAIYCTNILSNYYNYKHPTCYVIKAQAFDRQGINDSALYYANYVLSLPSSSYQDEYNMLYITTHYNPTIENTKLLEVTSKRADIGLALDNSHARNAQASEILRHDVNEKTDWRWLYLVCFTLLVIGIYVWRKRRKRQLLSQQVSELENICYTAKHQHEKIVQEHTEYKNSIAVQVENTCTVFNKSPHLQKDLHWTDYNQMCEIVNHNFFFFAQKLQNTHLLTEREIRLCVLVLIGITNSKQLADLLLYSESGIRNFKNRTAKKLNTNSVELRNQLLKIVVGE